MPAKCFRVKYAYERVCAARTRKCQQNVLEPKMPMRGFVLTSSLDTCQGCGLYVRTRRRGKDARQVMQAHTHLFQGHVVRPVGALDHMHGAALDTEDIIVDSTALGARQLHGLQTKEEERSPLPQSRTLA